MKREITFRAWDTYDNKWRYFTIGQAFGQLGESIYKSLCLDGATFYQFTGLKDKHGKEIYESDLLLIRFITKYYDLEAVYEVQSRGFTTNFFMRKLIRPDEVMSDMRLEAIEDFDWFVGERLEISYGSHNERQRSTDIEVIGNIYQNPELLKQTV